MQPCQQRAVHRRQAAARASSGVNQPSSAPRAPRGSPRQRSKCKGTGQGRAAVRSRLLGETGRLERVCGELRCRAPRRPRGTAQSAEFRPFRPCRRGIPTARHGACAAGTAAAAGGPRRREWPPRPPATNVGFFSSRAAPHQPFVRTWLRKAMPSDRTFRGEIDAWKSFFRRLLRDNRGATAIEYGLIVALDRHRHARARCRASRTRTPACGPWCHRQRRTANM